MSRTRSTVWAAVVLALAGGCASGPAVTTPAYVPPPPVPNGEPNPMLVPHLGASFESYRKVFQCAQSTLTDFGFEILESNTFDGHIDTLPRIAPGMLRPLRAGNSGFYERVLSTFQTYRHRVHVDIQPAENGGYWIQVIAYHELEDIPRPTRSTPGAAAFRVALGVERFNTEVIDPTVFEWTWIPRGRDTQIEQQLLTRMKKCL
jgi:hypothetical protein